MHILKRKIYKRGSSYEITIPSPLFFGFNLKKKYYAIFEFIKNRWQISFSLKQKSGLNIISRNIYKRGSSFETTLPLPLILKLKHDKNYFVTFKFDGAWIIDFEEINNER